MNSAPVSPCVHAVVVTYLPNVQVLHQLLAALAPQVTCLQIVDNTAQDDARVPALLDEMALANANLRRLGDNFGIARALNDGAVTAFATGATHVLLSDQDSLPRPDMVDRLLRTERELTSRGVRVGAVGPTFIEEHSKTVSSSIVEKKNWNFYGKNCASTRPPSIEIEALITSGTLIPQQAWEVVGQMRESLFIDKVDFEWCHRARASGFKLFGTPSAIMEHRVGDGVLRVWYFGWILVSEHSPLRMYYRVRNYVALCKLRYVPTKWKIINSWRTLGIIYSHVIFGRERGKALRMAVRGLWDGLRGRMGPWRG